MTLDGAELRVRDDQAPDREHPDVTIVLMPRAPTS